MARPKLPVSPNQPVSRQTARWLLILVGVVLAGSIFLDVYRDWMLEGHLLSTTLAENILPLLVSIGVPVLGWRWSRSSLGEIYAPEMAKGVLVGTVGTAFICILILGFQVIQGPLKPSVILMQLATVGAGAGLLVGYSFARVKETQGHLRRQRDLLKRSQEVASVGGWEYDPESDTVHGTEQLNQLLGLPEGADFDLERGFQFYPPEVRDQVREQVIGCLEDGTTIDVEVPLQPEEGEELWVRLQGERRGQRNGKTVLVGTLQDITEQKETERLLREEQEVLRRMYRITADQKLSFESKVQRLIKLGRNYLQLPYGFLTRVSERTQEILYSSGEHPQLQPGDTPPLSEAHSRETLHEKSLLDIPNAVEDGEGDLALESYELGSYICSTIRVAGAMYGILCFAGEEPRSDSFSEREKTFVELLTLWISYEVEQQRVQRQLKNQNERLDRFASVVSHDLRNPLNVAAGRLRLAMEDLATDDSPLPIPQAKEHLETTGEALERMDEIIDDMLVLTWGRRESDSEEIESIELAEAAERCWSHVGTAQASLSANTSLTIRAHEGRLQQLLENLFRNAIEHGSETVTVTVGALPGDDRPEGFFVEDDGPGIPKEKRDQIFETGYTTTEAGTGLGLSIVEAVANSHGWNLSVTESKGGGARFEIAGVEVEEW